MKFSKFSICFFIFIYNFYNICNSAEIYVYNDLNNVIGVQFFSNNNLMLPLVCLRESVNYIESEYLPKICKFCFKNKQYEFVISKDNKFFLYLRNINNEVEFHKFSLDYVGNEIKLLLQIHKKDLSLRHILTFYNDPIYKKIIKIALENLVKMKNDMEFLKELHNEQFPEAEPEKKSNSDF